MFSAAWWVTNATWNNLRSRIPEQMPGHHPGYYGPPPATPSRHASAGALQYGTPYHNPYYSGFQHLPIQDVSQQAGAGNSPERNLIDL
jgi:hypothetical protein